MNVCTSLDEHVYVSITYLYMYRVRVRAIPRPLRFKYLCLSSLQVRAIDNIALMILFKGRWLGFGGSWKLSDTTLLEKPNRKNLTEKT